MLQVSDIVITSHLCCYFNSLSSRFRGIFRGGGGGGGESELVLSAFELRSRYNPFAFTPHVIPSHIYLSVILYDHVLSSIHHIHVS